MSTAGVPLRVGRAFALASAVGATLLLQACSGLSGVGGETEFSCKAGKGVPCQSISGNNANYEANNLPFQRPAEPQGEAKEAGEPAPGRKSLNYHAPASLPTAQDARADRGLVSPSVMAAPSTGVPMRTPERILRVWFAPTELADGTFEDQRYVYVTVAPGRWLIDMNRQALSDRYAPVRNITPAAAQQSAATPPRPPAEQAREVIQQRTQ